MLFIQLLRSLDELLYELMSWLLFLPLTLLRILKRPVGMMRYAEQQLMLPSDDQFVETLSPPIMLIMTVVVSQAVAIALEGTSPIVASNKGLAAVVDDNTTLLLLRIFLFAVFALVMAGWKVRRSSVSLDRRSLKPAFYAQCYATSPFALLFSVAAVGLAYPGGSVRTTSLIALCATLIHYGIIETLWFKLELNLSYSRAFVDASIGLVLSLAMFLLIGLMFVQ